MNYTINEDVASKHHLTINDVLLMMLIKNKCDIENNIESLLHRDIITKSALFNDIKLTQHWNEELQKVLLDSDKVIPKTNDLTYLVTTLRNIYPKGIKSGSAAWRGNVREITLRLQTFFKIYGSTYNEEDIIEATKKYVESFNGNYTYMRILKYFILKDEVKINEDGVRYVEQISELANFLENDTSSVDTNWDIELR
jgi:hypothetical protein